MEFELAPQEIVGYTSCQFDDDNDDQNHNQEKTNPFYDWAYHS